MMDWPGFTPAEQAAILRVQRRHRRKKWWRRFFRRLIRD